VIPGDIHRQSKNFAFVAIDEFLKSCGVALFCGGNKQVFVLACDGRRQSVWIGGTQEMANL
jgi:hypothetical protein